MTQREAITFHGGVLDGAMIHHTKGLPFIVARVQGINPRTDWYGPQNGIPGHWYLCACGPPLQLNAHKQRPAWTERERLAVDARGQL
jgi:hypothetical protein